MSRYRPPAPKRSNYITAEGAQMMRDELRELWKVERPKVTEAVSAAAKNGDRSENGDYIYGKKRLREIDRRVRYLTKRLEHATVVDRTPADIDTVFFGAWVTIEDEDGIETHVRIVGPDEFDQHRDYISMDSPMARALLKRELDDEVSVTTPTGQKHYVIIEINYR